MIKAGPRSALGTPLPTPYLGDTFSSKFEPVKSYFPDVQLPDVSSAGETTLSHISSDADIDSHTEESSPEPDLTERVHGLGLHYNHRTKDEEEDIIDFFSSSQPVTAGTDRILATSPASRRPSIGLIMSPNAVIKRDFKSATEPNSPELKYRLIIRQGVVEKPKVPS